MPKLSVVFPILNEIQNPYFWESLDSLKHFKGVELIIVDGGSSDGTLERLSCLGVKPFSSAVDRASRLNKGVKESTGEIVLLHHPRSLISLAGVCELLKSCPNSWGGFSHRFDWGHPILRFTSWYSNHGRRNLWKILYLDHCVFFPRKITDEIFPLPAVEIFEDTLLSYRLRKKLGRPALLKQKVTTSAIRFRHRGPLRQAMVNQILKVKFHMGRDYGVMNQRYEKDLELNSKRSC